VNIYIALFRGINVGGKGILPMKDLVVMLEGMGCRDVRTYIQRGNVIFQSRHKCTNDMAGKFSAALVLQRTWLEFFKLQPAAEFGSA